MMLARLLMIVGGAALLAGLVLALHASREETKAIKTVNVQTDIFSNRPIDTGWWERGQRLARSKRGFRWGIGLTAAGIILQTIGSLLAMCGE